ncbi:TolC family protein [Hufsiella ginkgonis]|uniref:TolC family protein n=1 Tax=Hufsiella ginkgonis TaxID=2695274 RepID=A0A7K1XT44_9SPHI|nr:TolC family protein [Hufsiella ginkgonis]MXV13939.1 TolC family protein [Hufsiella ginkgonis]
MNYKILPLIVLLTCGFSTGYARQTLTIEEAIRTALDKNYDIKLFANDAAVSKNNVSRANAGMTPSINASLSTNSNTQNTRQTQSNGDVVTRTGARNSSVNFGPTLNWTIFDGFGMFATYDRLKELQKLGDTNLESAVLTTVFNVTNTYYDIVRQQKELEASKTALEISRLRLTNAKNRYEIGRAAKLEVLAATVDLNTDTTNLLRQRDLLRSTKITLNTLMNRDVNTDFTATETITIDESLQQASLLTAALQQNPSLKSAVVNRRIAELALKEVKANRYPTVGVNTGYNFSRTESELGFARQSRGRGFNYGLTASVPIFNGGLQKKNEKNAAIEINSAQLEYEKLELTVRSNLASAYQTYLTNLELVKLEAANQAVAKQNMDITLEKFRLGSIAPLEFREAQRNYVDATVRYSDAQYQAKLAEISLKEISGTLNLK